MVGVKTEAIFIGANRQTQVSDFHREGKVVAFGAGKTIALWNPLDPEYKGVYLTLKGHSTEVTCVKFMPGSDYLVSASEDSHCKIWKNLDNNLQQWECIQTIDHKGNSIICVAVLSEMLVFGAADGLITIWTGKEKFQLKEQFHISPKFYPLCLSLSQVADSKYLLAIGGTSCDIFIYSFERENDEIVHVQQAAVLQGHEDWIKSLAFRHQEIPGEFLLASGSQDRYIRLWHVRINDKIEQEEDELKLALLENKKYKFDIGEDLKVAINFEALIMGHDDWISSLQWHERNLELMASTADTAIMIWQPDESSGIWVCNSRLGEMSSKGASTATGSSGGFWSCQWFEEPILGKTYILTNGKTGSWRVWSSSDNDSLWKSELGISGATREVTDVAWTSEYLLSTSLDQTTRLYAAWKDHPQTWREFSRPQIHGYDMICVEPISKTRFVSGGDEKILRSFDLPQGVYEILQKYVGDLDIVETELPESATVPVLGLSNKAQEEEEGEEEGEEGKDDAVVKEGTIEKPPIEDELQRHLLWPEIEKLYGHGYEITCVDVSPDKKYIASACRSNNIKHAVVRIFETRTWTELKPPLEFHNLTITRLRFSPDSQRLLSVSRDRQWAIWKKHDTTDQFELEYQNPKAHSRIVWDCDWLPRNLGVDGFLTASRDKTVKLWVHGQDCYEIVQSHKFHSPVTAVSAHRDSSIAVGLETGEILLSRVRDLRMQDFDAIDAALTPAGRVNRLRWAPEATLLAAASEDHSTRIYLTGRDA